MLQARQATESIQPEQAGDRLLASLGLEFNPFSIAINQDSYYETAATRRIMELIVYGAETRKGFLLLSGEVGVGKSSLLLRLLARLKSRGMVSAMVVNSLLNKRELLESICADFGLKQRPGLTTSHLLIVLHTFFPASIQEGPQLRDPGGRGPSSGLRGPGIAAHAGQSGNRRGEAGPGGDLRSAGVARGVANSPAAPVRQPDQHCRRPAGVDQGRDGRLCGIQAGPGRFQIRPSGQALDLLWQASLGNPRTVNLLMERCLYAMVSRGRDVIDERIMRAAIQDLAICRSGPTKQAGPEKKRARRTGLAGIRGLGTILTAVAALLLGWFIGQGGASSLMF